MTEEQMPQNDLSSFEDDDIGIGKKLKKDRSGLSVRGIVFVLLVILLIIASFWISFLVGRKLLSPAKQIQELEHLKPVEEVQLPEANPVKDLPSPVKPKMPASPVMEIPEPAEPVVPAVVPPAAKPKVVKKKAPVKAVAVVEYEKETYVVRAGSFDTRDEAAGVVEKLRGEGFEAFQKPAGSSYVVQVGVFKSRENARKLVDELKAKGFEGKIVE